MTLNEVMKDTADAIREKTGKSELIAPVNFAEEIKSISAGGGESGGGRTIYVRYEKSTPTEIAYMFASLVKDRVSNQSFEMVSVIPALLERVFEVQFTIETLAFALDLDTRVVMVGNEGMIDGTIESALATQGVDINTLPRITKEQFYTLE